MGDLELRRLERERARLGLVTYLVVKDCGYEGDEVWCLVSGPPGVTVEDFKTLKLEHEWKIAQANGKWREREIEDPAVNLNRIQTQWLNDNDEHGNRDWPSRFWQSTVGRAFEAMRDAFIKPLKDEVGAGFDDFLVKHKGFQPVEHTRLTIT